VAGVAFALDGVIDDANGLACAHVHGADGVEEDGGLLFKHVKSLELEMSCLGGLVLGGQMQS
jgi:hypothetical protein